MERPGRRYSRTETRTERLGRRDPDGETRTTILGTGRYSWCGQLPRCTPLPTPAGALPRTAPAAAIRVRLSSEDGDCRWAVHE